MKVKEIYEILKECSPFEMQEAWDNCGLQVGGMENEVEHLVAALEIDLQVLEKLEPKSLVIVHHPLIFKGLKQLDTESYPSNYLKILLQKECVLIAMHTNFDLSHLNAYLCQEVLGFRDSYQENGIMFAKLPQAMALSDLAKKVQNAMGLPILKVSDHAGEIKEVGIVCGSGFSLFSFVQGRKNFCFLTGDIKYHDAMLASAMKVSLIDIMHYESERYFAEIIQRILQKRGYKVIISQTKNPFIFL